MRVPKRIIEILNKKQAYIDSNRDILEKSVIKMQSKLLDQLLSEVLPQLDVEEGVIKDSVKNYRLLADVDKVYKDFTAISAKTITSQVIETTSGLVNLGKNYFSIVLSKDLGARFDKVIQAAANKINVKIGITGENPIRGGFLESIVKDNSALTQVKNYVSKSITGQIDSKEFIKGLSQIVNGEKGTGILERQYQRYAYDLYQQYDRAYSTSVADEFNMNYFLYQGGLIEDSRDFCVAHNNKVWSREEAADWDTWKPYMGIYPAGYIIKQKDIYDIPSYLGYPGYQPLIDFGGYNCRHGIGWISDELALDLRPELKGTVNK